MSIFRKAEKGLAGLFGDEKHSHTHFGHTCDHHGTQVANRFNSFAPVSSGDVKWYVDGCSYFWAVSESLQSKSGSRGEYKWNPVRSLSRLRRRVFVGPWLRKIPCSDASCDSYRCSWTAPALFRANRETIQMRRSRSIFSIGG